MTDTVMKTETAVQDDANLTEEQRAYLEKINTLKAETKHLKFGTRLLDSTMNASTRELRGLIRDS
jgi:hypothetical protein